MSDYTGDDVSGQASNPGSVTSQGDFTIQAQAPETASLATESGQVAAAVMSLFGIAQALAGKVSVLLDASGRQVGFLMFDPTVLPMIRGANLAALLLGLGGRISPSGTISGPGITAGQVNGFESMPGGAGAISVYVDTVTVVDLDNPSIGMTVEGVPGVPPTRLGIFPGHAWGQCHGVTDPVAGVLPVSWPAKRTWNSTGINNAIGIPIMDYTNTVALFKGQKAFLLPDFIGGPVDGNTGMGTLWSLRTGKCLTPASGYGGTGFSVGQYANYQCGLLELVWTSAFRVVALSWNDSINVIDPSTGQTLVPVYSCTVEIWNGSQQMQIIDAPPSYGWNYTGPPPTAANPGYGGTLASILAISSYVTNSAVWTPAQLQTYYQGGGTEGPGEGEDC